MDQPKILDRAGENQLVNQQDNRLSCVFERSPFHFGEFVEPDFQVLEKLLFKLGFFSRVFSAAQCVEDAAGFLASRQEFNKGQLGERFVLKEKVASAEEPGGSEIGKDKVFVFAEVFLYLCRVLIRVGVVAPKRIGTVTLKKRFQFQR